jgi:drug/metabolite transporter (DMT)-like permease
MGMRWLASATPSGEAAFATVVMGNVIAFLVCLPFALPVRGTGFDWVVIAYLGVFQIGIAYWCLTHGVRHVPALEASLILLLEPALNPIWAWAVHGERPSAWAIAGGALILGATLAKGFLDDRPAAPTPVSAA